MAARCYGYICVENKNEEGIFSIENQRKFITDWAEKNNLHLVKIKEDEDLLEKRPVDRRPGLLEILNDITNNDILVVVSTTHMVKDFNTGIEILHEIEKKGAYFRSINEGHNTLTDINTMFARIALVSLG